MLTENGRSSTKRRCESANAARRIGKRPGYLGEGRETGNCPHEKKLFVCPFWLSCTSALFLAVSPSFFLNSSFFARSSLVLRSSSARSTFVLRSSSTARSSSSPRPCSLVLSIFSSLFLVPSSSSLFPLLRPLSFLFLFLFLFLAPSLARSHAHVRAPQECSKMAEEHATERSSGMRCLFGPFPGLFPPSFRPSASPRVAPSRRTRYGGSESEVKRRGWVIRSRWARGGGRQGGHVGKEHNAVVKGARRVAGIRREGAARPRNRRDRANRMRCVERRRQTQRSIDGIPLQTAVHSRGNRTWIC